MSDPAVFDRIYRENLWGGSESPSGPGSGTVERDLLAPEIIDLVCRLGIESVLDLGCGEGFWTPDLPGYVGLDISPVAVGLARQRHPDRDIRLDDGSTYPRADLVICRTVMQHMTVEAGLALLDRVRRSGASWLLATTYTLGHNAVTHVSIDNGGGYWPNLEVAPFGLGTPVESLVDGRTDYQDKGCLLALWPLP